MFPLFYLREQKQRNFPQKKVNIELNKQKYKVYIESLVVFWRITSYDRPHQSIIFVCCRARKSANLWNLMSCLLLNFFCTSLLLFLVKRAAQWLKFDRHASAVGNKLPSNQNRPNTTTQIKPKTEERNHNKVHFYFFLAFLSKNSVPYFLSIKNHYYYWTSVNYFPQIGLDGTWILYFLVEHKKRAQHKREEHWLNTK